MKVLVVEDNLDQIRFFAKIVKSLGHKVDMVTGGEEAVTLIGMDEPFDAIISDMQMPNGSGLYLLQYLDRKGTPPPCLIHSSEPTFQEGRGEVLELSNLPTFFNFATVELKDLKDPGETENYISRFLRTCRK